MEGFVRVCTRYLQARIEHSPSLATTPNFCMAPKGSTGILRTVIISAMLRNDSESHIGEGEADFDRFIETKH